MNNTLEIIQTLTQPEFIAAWIEEEKYRTVPDSFTQQRIKEHAACQEKLNYYLAATTPETLNKLIIGRPPGIPFREALGQPYPDEGDLLKVKNELTSEVVNTGSLRKSNFTLGRVYCPRRLVILGNDDYLKDFGADKLYAGNFHRFIAYAMWLQENPFQSIKVYYCEGPDCRIPDS